MGHSSVHQPHRPPGGDDPTDEALVCAARAGDRDAFAALVNRHRPMALALVGRLLGDAAAADAVQEAAATALVGLERLRAPDRFGAWFCGIALNVARRWRRESVVVRSAAVDHQDVDPGPAEVAEAAAVAREVRRAIADLAPGQRAAVLSFYWGDRSHLEAAAELGITAGAVKARLHQARASLRRRLTHIATPPAPDHALAADHAPKEALTMTPFAHTDATDAAWAPARVADVRRSADEDPTRRLHVVVLEEERGGRRLAVYIGAAEATALACTLESVEAPRPMTYAMAAGLVGAAGAQVQDVRITHLAEGTFYAVVRLVGPGGEGEVDARPSDAVNLALVCDAPVLVEEALLTGGQMGSDGWETAWRGFPSAAVAIATEVQERAAELAALRCKGSPSADT